MPKAKGSKAKRSVEYIRNPARKHPQPTGRLETTTAFRVSVMSTSWDRQRREFPACVEMDQEAHEVARPMPVQISDRIGKKFPRAWSICVEMKPWWGLGRQGPLNGRASR